MQEQHFLPRLFLWLCPPLERVASSVHRHRRPLPANSVFVERTTRPTSTWLPSLRIFYRTLETFNTIRWNWTVGCTEISLWVTLWDCRRGLTYQNYEETRPAEPGVTPYITEAVFFRLEVLNSAEKGGGHVFWCLASAANYPLVIVKVLSRSNLHCLGHFQCLVKKKKRERENELPHFWGIPLI